VVENMGADCEHMAALLALLLMCRLLVISWPSQLQLPLVSAPKIKFHFFGGDCFDSKISVTLGYSWSPRESLEGGPN
jgi:hypothetical protein